MGDLCGLVDIVGDLVGARRTRKTPTVVCFCACSSRELQNMCRCGFLLSHHCVLAHCSRDLSVATALIGALRRRCRSCMS